jgi:phage tail-like protein
MAVLSDTPYTGLHFTADLGDGQDISLFEAILPEARLQAPAYRDGNQRDGALRKADGLIHYGNLVLRRGVRGNLDWRQWWELSGEGRTSAFRTVIVKLLDAEHKPALLWKFTRARPVSHQFSPLNALAGGVLTETLELAFDAMDVE